MATYLLTWNPQRFDWFGIDNESVLDSQPIRFPGIALEYQPDNVSL